MIRRFTVCAVAAVFIALVVIGYNDQKRKRGRNSVPRANLIETRGKQHQALLTEAILALGRDVIVESPVSRSDNPSTVLPAKCDAESLIRELGYEYISSPKSDILEIACRENERALARRYATLPARSKEALLPLKELLTLRSTLVDGKPADSVRQITALRSIARRRLEANIRNRLASVDKRLFPTSRFSIKFGSAGSSVIHVRFPPGNTMAWPALRERMTQRASPVPTSVPSIYLEAVAFGQATKLLAAKAGREITGSEQVEAPHLYTVSLPSGRAAAGLAALCDMQQARLSTTKQGWHIERSELTDAERMSSRLRRQAHRFAMRKSAEFVNSLPKNIHARLARNEWVAVGDLPPTVLALLYHAADAKLNTEATIDSLIWADPKLGQGVITLPKDAGASPMMSCGSFRVSLEDLGRLDVVSGLPSQRRGQKPLAAFPKDQSGTH